MKVRVLRSALEDLAAGRRFYDQQADGVGSYFFDSLFSASRREAPPGSLTVALALVVSAHDRLGISRAQAARLEALGKRAANPFSVFDPTRPEAQRLEARDRPPSR